MASDATAPTMASDATAPTMASDATAPTVAGVRQREKQELAQDAAPPVTRPRRLLWLVPVGLALGSLAAYVLLSEGATTKSTASVPGSAFTERRDAGATPAQSEDEQTPTSAPTQADMAMPDARAAQPATDVTPSAAKERVPRRPSTERSNDSSKSESGPAFDWAEPE